VFLTSEQTGLIVLSILSTLAMAIAYVIGYGRGREDALQSPPAQQPDDAKYKRGA